MQNNIESLKYPIGKFEFKKNYTNEDLKKWIDDIEKLPSNLSLLSKNFTSDYLLKSYRKEGWNAKEIIHHIADSHINAYIRLKLTLTEESPVILPYNQDKWSKLNDVNEPIETSLLIIENVHKRMVAILKTMSPDDFKRVYIHPEYNKKFTLDEFTALYAWHGKQHLAHLNIILSNNF